MQEQRKEVDEEDKQGTDDAAFDPLEDGVQVVAALLTRDQSSVVVISAEGKFASERAQVQNCKVDKVSKTIDLQGG